MIEVYIYISDKANDTLHVWNGDYTQYTGLGYTFSSGGSQWNVTIQGNDYLTAYLADSNSCSGFINPGSSFLLNNACLFLEFDKEAPGEAKIVFTNNTLRAEYTFIVYKPNFYFIPGNELYAIDYGDFPWITVSTYNQCGEVWPAPWSNTLYTMDIIKGTEFGKLWNPDTDEYGNSLNV